MEWCFRNDSRIDRHPKQLHRLEPLGECCCVAEGGRVGGRANEIRFIYFILFGFFRLGFRLHLHFMSFLCDSLRCKRENRFRRMRVLCHTLGMRCQNICGSHINFRTHNRHTCTSVIIAMTRSLFPPTLTESKWWQSVAILFFCILRRSGSPSFYCLTHLRNDFYLGCVVNAQMWQSL